ncbi:MAG: transposase [Actinomycetales bacterium]|nr:transposase [Actinomycetales bacterium]
MDPLRIRPVLEPLLPAVKTRGRPWTDHRLAVEAMVWKYRTGAPWRDVPERFGKWNSIYKRFDRWAGDGTWDRLLAAVQTLADADGEMDWVVSTATRASTGNSTLPSVHGRRTGHFADRPPLPRSPVRRGRRQRPNPSHVGPRRRRARVPPSTGMAHRCPRPRVGRRPVPNPRAVGPANPGWARDR